MNIKTIVKVMNFHALIRVDRARKEADKYMSLEQEIVQTIDIVSHNRNFVLDKNVLQPSENGPSLRIYIGSDLGFCGSANSAVNQVLAKETGENEIIILGKKIHTHVDVLMQIDKDHFEEKLEEITKLVNDGIHRKRWKSIDLIYDRYYNMSKMEITDRTIFPAEMEAGADSDLYKEDFTLEGKDVNSLLEDLMAAYIRFELRSAVINVSATENVLRQNATDESLRRIDEMETEKKWQARKENNEKATRKVLDSFLKSSWNKE